MNANTLFLNRYTCYHCGQSWQSEDEAQPDDDCPYCGARHVAPHDSVETNEETELVEQAEKRSIH